MAKLPSIGVQTGNTSRGMLNPVLVDGSSAVSSIRAPYINPNAANIRRTDMPVPKIIVSDAPAAAANMAQVWTNAAMDYHDRQATARAEENMISAQDQMTSLFIEYETQVGRAGVDGYKNYQESINNIMSEISAGSDESVKLKQTMPLKKMTNNFLSKGAEHAAKQNTVWQDQIRMAKEQALERRLVLDMKDPEKMMNVLGGQMVEIAKQNPGNPEAAVLQQQILMEKTFPTIVETAIAKEDFGLAQRYIQIAGGIDSQFQSKVPLVGTDSLIKMANKFVDARARQNASRLTAEKEQAALIKQQNEEQFTGILDISLKTGDKAILNMVTDPEMRVKAEKLFDDHMEHSASSTDAEVLAMQRLPELADNPNVLLSEEWASLGPKRAEYYKKAVALRDENIKNLINNSNEFINSILPQPGPFTKFISEEVAAESHSMRRMFADAIMKAKEDGTSPELAFYETKKKIFDPQNPSRQFAQFKLQKGHLVDVPGLENGGLRHLDIDLQAYKTPEEKSYAIAREYKMASYDLAQIYGLTKANHASVLADPTIRKRYTRDATNLRLQYAYYMQDINTTSGPMQ